jgi:hypothetical protein
MIKNWSNITFLPEYQQKRTPSLVLNRYMDKLEFDLEFIIVEGKISRASCVRCHIPDFFTIIKGSVC